VDSCKPPPMPRLASADTRRAPASSAVPMSATDAMPPGGMVCLDSVIVLPAWPGRESLRSITVGLMTPVAGSLSGTVTSEQGRLTAAH